MECKLHKKFCKLMACLADADDISSLQSAERQDPSRTGYPGKSTGIVDSNIDYSNLFIEQL